MATNVFREAWIAEILSREESAIRFENFCIDLFSENQQVQYYATSKSWDFARDGKTYLQPGETRPAYLCASLESGVDDKARGDITRNVAMGNPRRITFCSSQRVSEKGSDALEVELRQLAPAVESIEVWSRIQIAPLAYKHPDIFEKYYAGELAAIRSALFDESDKTKDIQITGMRIALTTQFQDDAAGLRADVLRNLVITALYQKPSQTLRTLSKNISDALQLGRPIHESYFQD